MGEPDEPLPEPALPAPEAWPESLALADLELLPRIPWDSGLAEEWTPGEAGGRERLDDVLRRAGRYEGDRDRPALPSSQLSPHLHFGELSPRQVWTAVRDAAGRAAEPYLHQLGWRDFAHHLLYHFPHTA